MSIVGRYLTTANGVPVSDNQNSITAGPRGPIVFEDFNLFEKLAHFNRERFPERVWDFGSAHPDSLHQVPILFSDRGIPDGYRFMDGFGSRTFSLRAGRRRLRRPRRSGAGGHAGR